MLNARIRNSAVVVLFLVTACLGMTGAASAQNLGIGQLVQVSGNVKIDGLKADAGTTLASGDVVSTTSSAAVITLSNGQTITLSKSSEIQIQTINGQITVTTLKGNYSTTGEDATVLELARSAAAHDKGCTPSEKSPPGLAKKDPPCIPPGQVK